MNNCKEHLVCEKCGTPFSSLGQRMTGGVRVCKLHLKPRFCSKKCSTKNWHRENPEAMSRNARKYKSKNPEYWRELGRLTAIKQREKKKNSPFWRMVKNQRTRIQGAINSHKTCKKDRTWNLIGCTKKELFDYLEKQFTDGMSWDNYGDWHVDHIRPCASFALESKSEQEKCFHYTNLQPLWAEDNLRKSNKY